MFANLCKLIKLFLIFFFNSIQLKKKKKKTVLNDSGIFGLKYSETP